jgi:thiamine biosynthesis lipoprotein
MGTRWSVLVDSQHTTEAPALQAALQTAVDEVDAQMSTWKPDSDLMRLNAAPCGVWVVLPERLLSVLAAGLQISRATSGAFEMNVGAAVQAWGFGADGIDLTAIRSASSAPRIAALTALELDTEQSAARKTAPMALDLSGIAKGYGVDRLAEVLAGHGISQALCAIDGELRALGSQTDGNPWAVAIEAPDSATRAAHSVLALAEGAVATSGDYRHFLTVAGKRLSHTIDPRRGAPLVGSLASVSVMAADCMTADALATALMVMGEVAGIAFARQHGITALLLVRDGTSVRSVGTHAFADQSAAI